MNINRSTIGLNGMIASSNINYNCLTDEAFEIRRGNFGIRITSQGGFEKLVGGTWQNGHHCNINQ